MNLTQEPADEASLQASKKAVTLAGSSAGLISRFFVSPLDVVKIRLQLQSHAPGVIPHYNGILPTVKTILREEGVHAFWKGNIPAEILYLMYGGIQFLTVTQVNILLASQAVKDVLGGREIPHTVRETIAGGTAGGVAITATYPLDLLRTRFAAQGSLDKRVYTSIAGAVRDIYGHEGPGGFFKGLGASLGQIVPNYALFFGTYGLVHRVLSSNDVRNLLPMHPPTGKAWEDLLSGGIASVVAKTGVFPLDLIRKRLQVQGPHRHKYVNGEKLPVYTGGVLKTGREIVLKEGYRGLYRGLTIGLVKAVPTNAITMWAFGRALKFFQWLEEKEYM